MAILKLIPTGSKTKQNIIVDNSIEIQPLDWGMLRELDWKTGKASAGLKKLEGKRVRIPGYMVPFEDDKREVTEFLLVPSPQACIHVPPPPPNQMIYAKMLKPTEFQWGYRAIWLEGVLKLTENKSAYGRASFEMLGLGVRPFVPSDVMQKSVNGY
ncbi:MAG: hypothetical protein JWQ35_1486 [Bacteriovoracaceae bacterium]|nr:hypothetical protein [Bacteriovoracaceae bacterium]